MDKKEDFYKKLKLSLEKTTSFPSTYMYKFILPNDADKLKDIEKIFNYMGAIITTKKSKTKKYYSITIVVNMNSADDIIKKYKEAGVIRGLISL